MSIFPRAARFLFFTGIAAAWLPLAVPAHAARPASKSAAPDYVSVPFSLASQNKLLVSVQINGKRAMFVVDTGAPLSCVDESRMRRFGLNPFAGSEDVPATVIANGRQHRVTLIPALTLGPMQFTN